MTSTQAFANSLDQYLTAGQIVSGGAGAGAQMLVQNVLNQATQWITRTANRLARGSALGPEAVIRMWQGGIFGDSEATELLGWHGVDAQLGRAPSNALAGSWQRYIKNSAPLPPLELWRKWHRQGRLTAVDQSFDSAFARHGMRSHAVHDLLLNDWNPLSVGQAWGQYLFNGQDSAKFFAATLAGGMQRGDAADLLQSMRTVPAIPQLFEYRRRRLIDDDFLTSGMVHLGITDGAEQALTKSLLQPLPSADLVVSTAARIGQLPDVAARWGLDAERGDQYDAWVSMLGQTLPSRIDATGQPDPASPTWGAQQWRAHWMLPSLTLMAEMVHRVRGDPADPTTWSIPGVQPLSQEEIDDCFRAHGVPPRVRPAAQALFFRPISYRQILKVARRAKWDQATLQGRFRDMGYNAPDSADLAISVLADIHALNFAWQDGVAKKARDELLRELKAGYQLGGMDPAGFAAQLMLMGLDGDVIKQIIAEQDSKAYQSVITAVIQRAKSDWFAGRTDLPGALNRLISVGVYQPRAVLLTQAWQAERGEGRVVFSISKIMSLLRKGFISGADAKYRLTNLNVSNGDQAILLSEVQAEINSDIAKASANSALSAQRAQKAQQALLDKLAKAKAKVVSNMWKFTPIASIKRLVLRGIESPAWAEARMTAMGVPARQITDALAEWAQEAAGLGGTLAKQRGLTQPQQRALFPRAKLIQWLKDGVWDEGQVRSKMIALGYPQDDIDALIADAQHVKGTPGPAA